MSDQVENPFRWCAIARQDLAGPSGAAAFVVLPVEIRQLRDYTRLRTDRAAVASTAAVDPTVCAAVKGCGRLAQSLALR